MAHQATDKDWRELARRIQQEKDPEKIVALVQQLITSFDADEMRQHGKRAPQDDVQFRDPAKP